MLTTLGVAFAALGAWWLVVDTQRGAPRESAPGAEQGAPEPSPAELTASAAPSEESREPRTPIAATARTADDRGRAASAHRTANQDSYVLLAGTLVVPRGWNLPHFELGLRQLPQGGRDRSIGREEMQPLGEDAFAWSAGEVPPGRYEACLRELSFSVRLDVGSAGLPDALVEVPPPAEVRVLCVEASTGLAAVGTEVRWHCRLPAEVRAWTSQRATELGPGIASCRTPVGQVTITASGGGFGWKSAEVDVVPGHNEFVLELDRLASLTVVLRDGASIVGWGGLRPQLAQPGKQSRGRSWTLTSSGALTVQVPAGGRYTLTIPPIPGYEPVPPTEVELVQDETREHVVELVRQP